MSKRNQIGYSLVFWETLKEYNEKTKFYEPTKNKRVEVSQMLSEELSDDEEVKSLLIDKLFEYKDDIKKMLMNGEYCDIPSYHKESLEKDQRIADLEAKLAESEKKILELQEDSIRDNQIYNEQLAEKDKEIEEINKEFVQAVKDWKALVEIKEKNIAELEEQDDIYHNQDKIELLEKVVELVNEKSMTQSPFGTQKIFASDVEEIIDTLISEIRGEIR